MRVSWLCLSVMIEERSEGERTSGAGEVEEMEEEEAAEGGDGEVE